MARLIGQKLSEKFGQPFIIENQGGAGGNIAMGNAARAARRRLHDPVRVIELRRQSEPLPESTVRPRQGFSAGHEGGGRDACADRSPVGGGARREGTRRGHQGEPREVQHRFAWRRHDAVAVDRVVQAVARSERAAGRAVLRRQPGHSIGRRRPYAALLPSRAARDGADQGRSVARAGDHGDETLRGLLPDVPTLDELGIKDQEAETMQGVLVPAGTPKEIVDFLQREIAAILSTPDVREKILALGLRAVRRSHRPSSTPTSRPRSPSGGR